MPRTDAVATNFKPDTLKRFKDLCKQQGLKYTKVLEQLAENYLQTHRAVPAKPSVAGVTAHSIPPDQRDPAEQTRQELLELQNLEIIERLARVEADDREFVSAFEILLHRVEALEAKFGSSIREPKHLPHMEQ